MKKNQTLCIDLEDAVSMHYYTQTLLFDSNTVLNYQIKFYDVELWDNCKTAPSIVLQLCKLKAGLHKTTLVKNLLLQFAVWMSLQSQSQSSDIGQLQLLWGAQPFLSLKLWFHPDGEYQNIFYKLFRFGEVQQCITLLTNGSSSVNRWRQMRKTADKTSQ